MVKVTDQDYYLDGIHQKNLDIAKKEIKNDWDMIFAYDGSEGSGKSVKAMQDAYYCDPTLNLDRICFSPQEFKKAILAAKPFQSVVYDEAYTGLNSRATMSLINRALITMLAEIRQRNLFVFVVMPCFFDLDKYVALWRSRALIHIYTENGFQRGYFKFYNASKKKDLYINGKKFYNYSFPEANFSGRFTNYYVLDQIAYKKKKRDALIDRESKLADQQLRQQIEDELFKRLMELKTEIPHRLKMEILSIPESTYFYKLKKYEES